jgi:hypothetical protein
MVFFKTPMRIYCLLLLGFFSLSFYNLFFSLPESLCMNNVLLIASLSNKNSETQKALDLVKILESKMEELEKPDGNEICFFDLKTKKYKFFDQKIFNQNLNSAYYERIVLPMINGNDFYFRLHLCLNKTIRESNLCFYKNIFNNYHFLSWFFKSLRKSELQHNSFDLNLVLDSFPKVYLSNIDSEAKVGAESHIDFLLGYIRMLENHGILTLHSINKISFDLSHNIEESQKLINFSFESLVFGYRENFLNKKVDQNLSTDFFVKNTNDLKVKDYIFNYVVASFTTYVNYDNYSNNLYLDFDIFKTSMTLLITQN